MEKVSRSVGGARAGASTPSVGAALPGTFPSSAALGSPNPTPCPFGSLWRLLYGGMVN